MLPYPLTANFTHEPLSFFCPRAPPFPSAIFLHLLSVQGEALHSVAVSNHVGGPGVCRQQGLGETEC